MALEVKGTDKDRYGVITHLCGGAGGWRDTVEGVIKDINTGTYAYVVNVGGYNADVYVVPATAAHKAYLKTTADTTIRNNLDNLPSC